MCHLVHVMISILEMPGVDYYKWEWSRDQPHHLEELCDRDLMWHHHCFSGSVVSHEKTNQCTCLVCVPHDFRIWSSLLRMSPSSRVEHLPTVCPTRWCIVSQHGLMMVTFWTMAYYTLPPFQGYQERAKDKTDSTWATNNAARGKNGENQEEKVIA